MAKHQLILPLKLSIHDQQYELSALKSAGKFDKQVKQIFISVNTKEEKTGNKPMIKKGLDI